MNYDKTNYSKNQTNEFITKNDNKVSILEKSRSLNSKLPLDSTSLGKHIFTVVGNTVENMQQASHDQDSKYFDQVDKSSLSEENKSKHLADKEKTKRELSKSMTFLGTIVALVAGALIAQNQNNKQRLLEIDRENELKLRKKWYQ